MNNREGVIFFKQLQQDIEILSKCSTRKDNFHSPVRKERSTKMVAAIVNRLLEGSLLFCNVNGIGTIYAANKSF